MVNILNAFMDLLYPSIKKCCICNEQTNQSICSSCMSLIRFVDGVVCLRCGKGLSENYHDVLCPDCKNSKHHYDMAFTCFEYKGMGKNIIHKLKYEGKKEIAQILGKLMADKIKTESIMADVIVPVPIHEKKLIDRGFNQALLIAETLSRALNIPLLDCLGRKKETKDQYALDKSQRMLNVSGAFEMKSNYNLDQYKNILLLDDVYTTGSTVNECSKILKKQGVAAVYVITAATGINT